MEIIDIAQAISEYGFEVVVAAFFLVIYLTNERKRSKKAESSAIQREENLTHTIEKLIDKIENTTHLTAEQESLQSVIEQKIDVVLEKLRDKTNAGRAVLIRYHNGGKDLVGNSFLRFSCTNEKVANGIKSGLPDLKNQFRSLIGPLYEHLKENDSYNFENVEKLKEEGHITMYEFFKSRNILSSCAMPIRTKKGYNIGYIAIEYLGETKKEEVVRVALNEAREEIATLLSLKSGG